ncbi:hypothetical protein KSC_025870 [Ktedonobacter sp. SOSP1-52]|nr:hypothetical protein KSC_025870 [Ktedonobacter sp. SOSP1-52]
MLSDPVILVFERAISSVRESLPQYMTQDEQPQVAHGEIHQYEIGSINYGKAQPLCKPL